MIASLSEARPGGYDFADIPQLAGAEPLLGHFRLMHGHRMRMLDQLAAMPGDLARVAFPGHDVVTALSRRAVHDVLVGQAASFEKSPMFRMALYPVAGNGLFTSEGSLWRRQRKLMSPIFRRRELHRYADAMAACAERGAAGWRDGAVIDAARETMRIAMSIAGKTLFNADTFGEADELGAAMGAALDWFNEHLQTPLLVAQARARSSMMRAEQNLPAPFSGWCAQAKEALRRPLILPGAHKRKLQSVLGVLERRVTRMIAERRNAAEPEEDLLTQLLRAVDEDGTSMGDRQIRDEILTLFIAGHETTATGLAWALYLLVKHPECYRRARAEVDAIAPGRLRFEHLQALPYCTRVFKEALRLYPPVYLVGRQAIRPVQVAGYQLPTGCVVQISAYILHRSARLWPEPERFDPERFTPEAERARPRGAFMPFGDGPRSCIGSHFALMEGPLILATLLRHADLSLVDGASVEPHALATLKPRGGIPLRVHLRH